MTDINATNAITEYKKRLGELVKELKKPAPPYTATFPRNEKYTVLGHNQALDDVLDLINSTN